MPQEATPRREVVMEAYRAIARARRYLKRETDRAVREHGLTRAQLEVLVRTPPEGIPVTDLAERMWSNPGNMSAMVSRMVDDGWLKRRRSADDRRVVFIEHTQAGRSITDQAMEDFFTVVEACMDDLTDEELATIGRLLPQIYADDPEFGRAGKQTPQTSS